MPSWFARGGPEQPAQAVIFHETLQPARFEASDLAAGGRQLEVPAALESIATAPAAGPLALGAWGVNFLDQPIAEERTERAIEVRREHRVLLSLLDFPDQAPAVALAAVEGEQDVEDERLERQEFAKIARHPANILSERDYCQDDTSRLRDGAAVISSGGERRYVGEVVRYRAGISIAISPGGV